MTKYCLQIMTGGRRSVGQFSPGGGGGWGLGMEMVYMSTRANLSIWRMIRMMSKILQRMFLQ